MPSLAGQNPDNRGVKIVTGAKSSTAARESMAALQRDGVRMATAVALIVGRLHRRGVGHAAAVILFGDG
jgi:hypothetical protein